MRSEINTLAYPPAALFGFCMGLVLFNILGVARAALRAEHGHDKIERTLSHYHAADEVSAVWRGMPIVIPDVQWVESYGSLSLVDMAKILRSLAKQLRLPRNVKHPRGPKKPPPQRTGGVNRLTCRLRVFSLSENGRNDNFKALGSVPTQKGCDCQLPHGYQPPPTNHILMCPRWRPCALAPPT